MDHTQFLDVLSRGLRKPLRAIEKYRNELDFSVGDLADALDIIFPSTDAESWDNNGLMLGNAQMKVTRIAVALDVTPAALTFALDEGANVLLTHHPIYLDTPDRVVVGQGVDDVVVECMMFALKHDIALINIHTPLDASALAHNFVPARYGLRAHGIVEPLEHDPSRGYGHICTLDEPMSLARLCELVRGVDYHPLTVWGDADSRIERVAFATGSAGGMARACMNAQVDCLVCGEMKYHEAMASALKGLCVVELGHDVSEFPLCDILAGVVGELVSPARVIKVPESARWHSPKS